MSPISANRGRGRGSVPAPGQTGAGGPVPVPGQSRDGDGDGDRGVSESAHGPSLHGTVHVGLRLGPGGKLEGCTVLADVTV